MSLPRHVTVGSTVYTLRPYTPKRQGESADHGWVRATTLVGKPHRSEVSAEMKSLIDEIVRLRALCGESP